MLVLTRTSGEAIVIDGNVWVTVLSVHAGKVRLGITAPASVRIDRREIHDRRAAGPVAIAELAIADGETVH